MFSIHSKRRTIISLLVIVAVMIPVATLIANKIMADHNTSALTYTIPDGYTTITDPNFYNCVATKFKEKFSSEVIPSTGLTDEQLGKITNLSCTEMGISNVDGLAKMVALRYLNVYKNDIAYIDVSKNVNLQYFTVDTNRITSLDLRNNSNLVGVYASLNAINNILFPSSDTLKEISLYHNELNNIDISMLPNLKSVGLSGNNLRSIDLSNNSHLVSFSIGGGNGRFSYNGGHIVSGGARTDSGNKIQSIDLSHNTELEYLDVSNNELLALDVFNNTQLICLEAQKNHISDIASFVKLTNLDPAGKFYYHIEGGWTVGSNCSELPYRAQTINDIADGNVYELPSMFLAANSTLDISGTTSLIEGLRGDLLLDNATLNLDGKSITITDVARPATVKITSGYAEQSVLTIEPRSEYSLNFDNNGGSGTVENQNCYYTSGASCEVVIPDTIPTRSGYYFLGWSDIAGAITGLYEPGSSLELTTSKTVYAIWAPVYTLNFDLNIPQSQKEELDSDDGNNDENDDDMVSVLEPQSCHPETTKGICTVTIPSTIPLVEDYEFFGWASDAEATKTEYLNEQEYIFEAGNYNKTLYAVWGDGKLIWIQGQEHIKGDGDDAIVKINYPVNHFEKLLIDGKEYNEKKYKFEEGSTIITIYDEYLDEMELGQHTLIAIYDNGLEAKTVFTVDEIIPVPDTGTTTRIDENDASIMINILPVMITLLPIVFYIRYNRKSRIKID